MSGRVSIGVFSGVGVGVSEDADFRLANRQACKQACTRTK